METIPYNKGKMIKKKFH